MFFLNLKLDSNTKIDFKTLLQDVDDKFKDKLISLFDTNKDAKSEPILDSDEINKIISIFGKDTASYNLDEKLYVLSQKDAAYGSLNDAVERGESNPLLTFFSNISNSLAKQFTLTDYENNYTHYYNETSVSAAGTSEITVKKEWFTGKTKETYSKPDFNGWISLLKSEPVMAHQEYKVNYDPSNRQFSIKNFESKHGDETKNYDIELTSRVGFNPSKLTITGADGTSKSIIVEFPNSDIEDEKGVVKTITPEQKKLFLAEFLGTLAKLDLHVLNDFVANVSEISIENLGRNDIAGQACTTDVISLDFGSGISVQVLTHEIGHTVDSRNIAEYYSNDRLNWAFDKCKNYTEYLPRQKKSINPFEKAYALTNIREFFAEYYSYKYTGKTSESKGAELFKKLLDKKWDSSSNTIREDLEGIIDVARCERNFYSRLLADAENKKSSLKEDDPKELAKITELWETIQNCYSKDPVLCEEILVGFEFKNSVGYQTELNSKQMAFNDYKDKDSVDPGRHNKEIMEALCYTETSTMKNVLKKINKLLSQKQEADKMYKENFNFFKAEFIYSKISFVSFSSFVEKAKSHEWGDPVTDERFIAEAVSLGFLDVEKLRERIKDAKYFCEIFDEIKNNEEFLDIFKKKIWS